MTHRKSKSVAALLVLTIVAAGAATTAGADTLLVVKRHANAGNIGMMKQPARDSESKVWLGDKRVRRDDGQATSIMRLDKNKMYLIDNASKTYHVIDLPIDYRKLNPQGGQAAMDQVSALSKMDVTVTPRDESKKIGTWDAKRYDVVMTNSMGMKIENTLWVSDIGVDSAELTKMTAAVTSLQPGTLDWVKKMEAIPGYPVLQETTVTIPGGQLEGGHMSSTEQLVSIEKKDPPAGLYDPPAGYKLLPFDPASRAANGE